MGNIVLVGAGGTGMSALAMLFDDLGYDNIVCIDKYQSEVTDRLTAKGMKVIIGHGNYEVQHEDFVIYTNIKAVKEGPEVSKSFAFSKDVNVRRYHRPYTYSEFLGEISKHFTTISFAGSNGKSSITGLGIYAAKQIFPSFGLGILGAFMPDFGNKNYVLNEDHKDDIKQLFDHIFSPKAKLDFGLAKKYLFFLEACEYRENFLHYDSDYSLITNLDHDHTDYFKTMKHYVRTFEKLIHHTKRTTIISSKVETTLGHYGLDIVKAHSDGLTRIAAVAPTPPLPFMHLFGVHHQRNAAQLLELFATLEENGVHTQLTRSRWADVMLQFKGLWRRMELLKDFGGGRLLYTDYSHHAPAIEANYQALRAQFPDKKLVALFQPHQAKRVVEGRHDFVTALKQFDEAIIYKLYTARERVEDFDFTKVTHHDITDFDKLGEVFAHECEGSFEVHIDHIVQRISKAEPNTLFVIFAAGDLDYLVRTRLG